MTLALLLTAVTGAWATDPTVYESGQTVNQNDLKVGDIILGGVTINGTNEGGYITLIAGRFSLDGNIPDFNSEVNHYPITVNADGSWKHPNTTWVFAPIDASGQAGNAWEVTAKTQDESNYDVSIVGIQYVADAIDVIPVTGKTITMPAFDVEIAPIYAPVAQWATEGDKVLTPTAAEGIYAESTDSIITPGKVAKIGETEDLQGEVMYFATGDKNMTAEQAMAANGWLSKLPTAAGYERDTTIYVWYYIKGADTPEGKPATAENTFNDSEICTEPIEVKILSNKFDIQFKAANDNTIEAGKATVTANGEQKTVNEGKLEGVKMGSEVKVTAKDGYKFRKVEAKKGGPKTITIEDVVIVYEDGDTWEKIVDRNPGKVVCDSKYALVKGSVLLLNGNYVEKTDVIVPDGVYTLGLT